MGVVFLGSEFDGNAWELAARLGDHISGMRLIKMEDANGLLEISDNDVILGVARGIDRPETVKPDELRKRQASGLQALDLVSFLGKMERIGRAKGVTILLVPEQADDAVIDSVCGMLPKK